MKNFESEKIWGHKNFGSKNVLGPKIFYVQINLRSKKILGSKKFWVQKNYNSIKIWAQKKSGKKKVRVQNIFGPKNFGSK